MSQMLKRAAVAAGLFAAALVAAPGTAVATPVNLDKTFVQFYDNNIENLETKLAYCSGDWQDLIYYMERQSLAPDIFTVQQLDGQQQLNQLLQFMNTRLGVQYSGILADANPGDMTSPNCGDQKKNQTNAIIYRLGRFSLVGATTWQAYRWGGSSCVPNDTTNNKFRTKGVVGRFKDLLNGRYLTVSSIHWPTDSVDEDNKCATLNALASSYAVSRSADDSLRIWAGDTNARDFYDGSPNYAQPLEWYQHSSGDRGGDLGFRDPVAACGLIYGFSLCRQVSATGSSDTVDHRYDYVFARKGNGALPTVNGLHTISYAEGDEADRAITGADVQSYNGVGVKNPEPKAIPPFPRYEDGAYSEHRAIRVQIYY